MTDRHHAIEAFFTKTIRWISRNRLASVIIASAFVTNLSLTVFNGIRVCIGGECGLYVGSLHSRDFLWHLALAESAFKTYPFQVPVFSGASLAGYNFLMDLVISLFARFGIPAMSSYFLLFPLAYLISVTYLGYRYLKMKNRDPLYIACGLFFIFFGSSFSYVLSLYHNGTWQSFGYAQAMQSGRALLNLQYALTLPFMLAALVVLERKKIGVREATLLGVFLFVVFGLKFYGGFVLLFLILANRAPQWIRPFKKETLFELAIYGAGCIAAYLMFYRSSTAGAFPFAFSPFSIAHPLIEERDMFYLPSLVLARYTLAGSGVFSPRLLAIELFTAGVFVLYNLGTRIIGLASLAVRAVRGKIDRSDGSMICAVFVSSAMTLFFVQEREWWNIIQFFGYTLFFMNFFAGEALYRLLKLRRVLPLAFGVLVILMTLPTNIEQVMYAAERNVNITDYELASYEYLRKQPDGVVLALPLQETSAVTAFSGKQQYMADINPLNLLGIPYKERMNGLKDPARIVFDEKEVTYVYYLKKGNEDKKFVIPKRYVKVFENRDAAIFRKQ
jgi:hypothetical protein